LPDHLARLQAALVDRYRFERALGRGGMATVYLAEDLKHDRQVAIKVLRPELAAVLGRERFLAEIRLTAKLDHPHILTLIDSGEVIADDDPTLVDPGWLSVGPGRIYLTISEYESDIWVAKLATQQ
jgi:serine/threonine protein kinase